MATILVVDDNEVNRYLQSMLLENAGHTVFTAANGAEALAHASRTPPDLIISDVLMPVMDGFALRRELLRTNPLHAIPFVFYTATFNESVDAELGLQLGAARYLTAPLEHDAYLAEIEAVLQSAASVPSLESGMDDDGSAFYRLYNAVLVNKLEAKMNELALANQRLIERERFVTDILDGLSAHVAIVDSAGTILAVNAAWRRFAETNPPVMGNVCEGANYLAVCDRTRGSGEQEARAFGAAIRSVLSGERESAELEYPCHSASEQRWFIGRITRFPGDGPPRVIVAHEDITNRVVATQALRNSEDALRRSQEVAHVGNWVWDVRNNTVTWSDEMKRIFGLNPEEFDGDLNTVIEHSIHPDDRPRVVEMNEAVIRESHPAETEYRVVWPNGEVRTIWARPGDRMTNANGEIVRLSGIVQDITERKRIEDELRQALRRLSIATRAAGQGIWESDIQNGVEYWDDLTYSIYGVSKATYTPTLANWRSLVHPEDLPHLLAMEEAAFANHTTAHLRFRICRPDGATRYIESHAEAQYAADGSVQRIYGVDRDVTDQVGYDLRLRLQDAALHAAANGIVITNLDGVIEWANPAFVALTGYALDEAKGHNPRELVRSGLHNTSFYQNLWDTILAGKVWNGRLVNRRKDGSLYHEEQTITPVRNEQGEITHFIGIKHDITAQVRDEEERISLLAQMQAQAEQLAQIMQSVPDGLLLLDAELRVVHANRQAQESLHQLAGDGADGVIRRLGDCTIDELLASPPVGQWHAVQQGEQRFEVLAQPAVAGPLPAGWVMVIRNVTEQHNVQRQLQSQERLAAVGQLAAGIAHDFNNIMSVIVTYAELTADLPALTMRERERVMTIRQQALRATQMIRQILDFSRRSVIERHTFDLLTLLKEQVKLLKQTLPENIEIEFAFTPEDFLVDADPTRIQQMLINLAVNARDAMPDGGRLRLEIGRCHVDSSALPLPGMDSGQWVTIRVSDTGVGIPDDVIGHIFEPFFTTKELGKGTGLGLAQVHGIVAQHGGHINVESAPGAGTTFTVYLPAVVVLGNGAAADAEAARMHAQGHGEAILIVEDEDHVRQALVELLTAWNYRTLIADNGEQAIAILTDRAAEIDLVLSDVVMPKMGGVGLLQEMRRRGLATPVVLMTGHAFDINPKDLMAYGLSGWLAKPPALKELAETVERTLARRQSGVNFVMSSK